MYTFNAMFQKTTVNSANKVYILNILRPQKPNYIYLAHFEKKFEKNGLFI